MKKSWVLTPQAARRLDADIWIMFHVRKNPKREFKKSGPSWTSQLPTNPTKVVSVTFMSVVLGQLNYLNIKQATGRDLDTT